MPHMISRRTAAAGLTAAGLTAVLGCPRIARAARRVVRFGHNQVADSHYGRGAIAFADAVAADPVIGSVIKIEIHGNAELGDELGMLKSCASGALDMMLCSNAVMGNLVPDVGLLNAPFLFPGAEQARAVLDGGVGQELAQATQGKGITILAWGENGLRHITANQPIRRPADLQGLKLRVPQSEIMLQGMRALGVDAAPLNFNLLHEALRTGQFQGQENPIVVIKANKLYEVQKVVSLTGHIYDAACFITCDDLMEDLTEPQRAALSACAKKGAEITRQISSEAQRTGIAELQELGMTVVADVDTAAFRTAAMPYLNGLTAKHDAARVNRLIHASS